MIKLKDIAGMLEAKGMQKYASEVQSIEADIKKLLPEDEWWEDRARQLGMEVPADAPHKESAFGMPEQSQRGFAPSHSRTPSVSVTPRTEEFARPGETVEELTPGGPSRLISWLVDPVARRVDPNFVPKLEDVVEAINSGRLTYSRIQQEAAKAPEGRSKDILKSLLGKLHAVKYKMASELIRYASASLKVKGYDALSARLKTAAVAVKHPDEHSIPSIETVHEGSPEVEAFEKNLIKLAEVYSHISSLIKSFATTYKSESNKLSKDPKKEEASKKLVALVTKEDAEVDKIIHSFKFKLPSHPINK